MATRLFVILLLVCALAPAASARAEEKSLGEKIKDLFEATPTPTPHRHRSTSKKESTPTPTATPTKHKAAKAKASPTPEESPTPDESATPASKKRKKKKSSPTPTPEESPSPTSTPKESPSPSATATASPSPDESPSPEPSAGASPEKQSIVASISPDQIKNYDKVGPEVRKVLETALGLTNRDLKYTYGSADPGNGGMDCSGFIYYVLRENGVKDVPRDASGQYVWVRKAGNFRSVLSADLESFELDELKPGDLLFWTGTYDVDKDPPVTHTMIYLGENKESGKPVMIGASDGRSFEGKRMFGVSVFDFKTSGAKSETSSGRHPRFVGYGRIPGL